MRKIVFLQYKCSRLNQDRVWEGEQNIYGRRTQFAEARGDGQKWKGCSAGATSTRTVLF